MPPAIVSIIIIIKLNRIQSIQFKLLSNLLNYHKIVSMRCKFIMHTITADSAATTTAATTTAYQTKFAPFQLFWAADFLLYLLWRWNWSEDYFYTFSIRWLLSKITGTHELTFSVRCFHFYVVIHWFHFVWNLCKIQQKTNKREKKLGKYCMLFCCNLCNSEQRITEKCQYNKQKKRSMANVTDVL